MKLKLSFLIINGLFLIPVFLIGFNQANAAIEQVAPPIDALHSDIVTGPGSVIPLARFMFAQSSGSDYITKIGLRIRASSTLNQGEIAKISLWKESGQTPDFQPDEDIQVSGAASTSPLVDTFFTLIPSDFSQTTLGSSPTEFYIVASTSAIDNIVNGHAFDIVLPQNFASTSANTGVGTPFSSQFKVVLEQNIPVVISEVRIGSSTNDRDEFIELYNKAPIAVNLEDAGLSLFSFNALGGAVYHSLVYNKKIIPGYGYFLIASKTNYSGTVSPDATYDNSTVNVLVPNGGVSIATSTNVVNATSSKIDLLGWGNQPVANTEGGAPAPALLEDGNSLERIARGDPATSTAQTLAAGGPDEFKGNGFDSNLNNIDFVLQSAVNPQNSNSPLEFPFGGPAEDNQSPWVMGSFPQDKATNIPIDLNFIGFGFNEPIDGATIVSNTPTTTVTLVASGSSDNLCSSVSYNPNPGAFEPPAKCNLSSSLAPNTTYTFSVGTSVLDLAGNHLDQNPFTDGNQSYSITFTTGGSTQTLTNITPPHIIGSFPFPGSFGIPTNISKFFVKFSQNMDSTSLNASTIKLYSYASGSPVALDMSSAVFSWDATSSTLIISNLPSLSDHTHYELKIDGQDSTSDTIGVKSSNGILLPMPDFVVPFDTGTSDNSAPSVLGTMPIQNGDTNVPLNTVNITISFDDHIDASTATTGSVILSVAGGPSLPGAVSYDPMAKELIFTAQNVLPAGQNLTLTLVGSSIKNISGVPMGSDYILNFSTESSNSDNTPPSILFVNADEFGVAVTFNEAVNKNDVVLLDNYSLVADGQSLALSSLAGHRIKYEASKRTAKIENLHLAAGANLVVTASNIHDISGNLMDSSSGSCTVKSMAESGGFIDPGMSTNMGMVGPPPAESFSGAGGSGFMPGASVMVMNNFVGATSTYGFEIPISKQIPANGQIVITFPSNSDFGLNFVATSSPNLIMLNDVNRDINGPGPGTIGIKSISGDNQSKAIILTIDSATRNENSDTHDFLKFGITNIKNPSIPKGPDSNGYLLDIKTRDSSGKILESGFNLNPVYIGGGNYGGRSTTTLQGQILSGYDNTTGLNGARVLLHSPSLGPVPRIAVTSGNGNFSFDNLPVGDDYFLFTEPEVNPTGTSTSYFGYSEPSPVRATSTNTIVRNLILTPSTNSVSLTIKLTAGANTFGPTEKVDIFAGGPDRFVVKTITPGSGALSAANVATLHIPQVNGMWFVGIGPAMPKDGIMMGPPPSPDWSMPKPAEFQMSGCPAACKLTEAGVVKSEYTFVVSKADKSIAGIVQDSSGTKIAGAMVYAYSSIKNTGSNTQTDTAGRFSLSVSQGIYNVGAFFPGIGHSNEATVEVDSSGNVYVDGSKTASTGQSGSNPFIIVIRKPSYTISGRVTNGTDSVANAPVFAYRTDGPGHVDTMTDTSGNYTLYVDNGTWVVSTYIPGYGKMPEETVVVSGSNKSNINFAPSGSTTYWNISGYVFESSDSSIDDGEGVANVIVLAKRGGNVYETKTGSDGSYTLRVPQSLTGYTLEAFKTNYGKIPSVDENLSPIGSFGVTNNVVKNIRINTRQNVTINIKDSNGQFITLPEVFIDLFDLNSNFGNHTEILNGTSTIVQIPNNASTTVRVSIPSVPSSVVSVASDNPNTLVIDNVLKVDGNETIKIVVNTNLYTVSGRVYSDSAEAGNELDDAWVEVVDTSNGLHYGTAATSSGHYILKLSSGNYTIVAVKPGYTMSPQSLSVSGDTTKNLVLNSAPFIISGQITAGGSPAANAFVRAEKVGGGFAVAQADANGNYRLAVGSGKWRIFASSERYQEAGYANNPLNVDSNKSGINIALTTQANIQEKLASSPTFKDLSSGSLEDPTLNVKVTVGSGTLGQSGSDAYITAKETANYPKTPSVNIIANKAKEINAYSGGSQVKNLSSGKKAEIELTYSVSELASSGIDTPGEVSQLKVAAWSDSNEEWESLNTIATYKDINDNPVEVDSSASSIPNNVVKITFKTVEATHFSPYALVDPSDPAAPATPSGLTATAASAGTNQISLNWNAVSGAAGYYLYRDTSESGSFPLLANVGNNLSYTDTGLTFGTTYYYKVSAYKSGGTLESAASSPVSATPLVVSGGGLSYGGGFGAATAPTIPVQPRAEEEEAFESASKNVPEEIAEKAAPQLELPEEAAKVAKEAVAVVSPVFNKTLRIGMFGKDVKRLQQLLNSDPATRLAESGPGSLGHETNYFGRLTRTAVRKFQCKYGIVCSGDEETTGYGLVGPKTRAKLREVFSKVPLPSSVSKSLSYTFTKPLYKGISDPDVKRLQQLLNSDPDTRLAESGVGSPGQETNYFGSLTERAVQRFQEKYGIAKKGDPGYGYVGPKTRAKLNELFSSQQQSEQQPSLSARPKQSEKIQFIQSQINSLLEQIQALQAELQKKLGK